MINYFIICKPIICDFCMCEWWVLTLGAVVYFGCEVGLNGVVIVSVKLGLVKSS